MPEKKAPKVKIVQDMDLPEVPKTVLASAILGIASGVRKLQEAGLRRGDLVALILERAPKSHVGKRAVESTLDALEQLEKDYARR